MIRATQYTRDDGSYVVEERRGEALFWSLRQDASTWAGMYYWDFVKLRWEAAHNIMDFTTFYVSFEQAIDALINVPTRTK